MIHPISMLKIPPQRLSPDVLDALIEEFVTRHGTNLAEASAKAAQVRTQLATGQIMIVYDEKTDSTNIVAKDATEPAPAPISPAQKHHSHAAHNEPRIIYDEPTPPDPSDY